MLMFGSNVFGGKKSKKQIQREQLAANRRKGRAGEEEVKWKYILKGYEVERTGRGHDLRVRRRDNLGFGRVVESKVVEVKTGKAKLSKLQKKTKKKQSNYKVERTNPLFF